MIKLIASDIDSTLIDNKHPICQENLDAISYLKQKNVKFVLCTGKSYTISKDFCKKVNADFGIFGNGSHVIDLNTGKEIFKNTISLDSLKSCLEIIKKYNLHIHAYTDDSIITPKLSYLDLRNYISFQKKVKIVETSNIYDELIFQSSRILQLVVSSDDDISELKYELEQLTGISIMHIRKTGKYRDNVIDKDYEYLDISASNVSKGNTLKRLIEYLGISKDEAISIGDNINDISMFEICGIGIAVKNAYDETKQAADYVTNSSAGEGAFSEAVHKFI